MDVLTRTDMIDEMMEGVAFEEDYQVERAMAKFNSMSDEEIKKEYKRFIE